MRWFLCVLLLLVGVVGLAQEATPEVVEDDPPTVRVFVDSLIIRELPTRDSEQAGSAFEGDVLEAVGRNADGMWFQVRRPFDEVAIGWVFRQYVGFTFEVGTLPLTDAETGVTGDEEVVDTGIAAFILTEAALRDAPSINGNQIGVVPITRTIPAFERSPDNLWYRVNYLGTTGWVAEFLVRLSADADNLPVSPDFTFRAVPLEIIPVEVQLAQLERLRAYVIPLRDLADVTANFWAVVATGQSVPCEPAPGGIGYFPLTPRDVVELPELRRYTRQLNAAVDSLNRSLEIMQPCGVFTEDEHSEAYAGAINARLQFNAVLDRLDALESVILE